MTWYGSISKDIYFLEAMFISSFWSTHQHAFIYFSFILGLKILKPWWTPNINGNWELCFHMSVGSKEKMIHLKDTTPTNEI